MYVEQLAPHSVEAEESAIGAVLIDAGVLPHVAGIIAPEDFYRERHRLIWKSVLNLWRGGGRGRPGDSRSGLGDQ